MLAKRRAKNGRGRLDDVMLGLEPGHMTGSPSRVRHLPEADEGLHLVDVAAHRLAPSLRLAHRRVGSRSASRPARRAGATAGGRAGRTARDRCADHALGQLAGSRAARGRSRVASGSGAVPGARLGEQSPASPSTARRRLRAARPRAAAARAASRQPAKSVADGRAAATSSSGEQALSCRGGGRQARRAASAQSSAARPACRSGATTNGCTLRERHVQAREVVEAQAPHAPRREHALDRPTPRPGTRSSISRGGAVEVDREALAVRQRPGELGIDLEVEHAAGRRPTISSRAKP